MKMAQEVSQELRVAMDLESHERECAERVGVSTTLVRWTVVLRAVVRRRGAA